MPIGISTEEASESNNKNIRRLKFYKHPTKT